MTKDELRSALEQKAAHSAGTEAIEVGLLRYIGSQFHREGVWMDVLRASPEFHNLFSRGVEFGREEASHEIARLKARIKWLQRSGKHQRKKRND